MLLSVNRKAPPEGKSNTGRRVRSEGNPRGTDVTDSPAAGSDQLSATVSSNVDTHRALFDWT